MRLAWIVLLGCPGPGSAPPVAAPEAPPAAESACVAACVQERQMQAVSIEQIRHDCEVHCGEAEAPALP